jgi:hypothetical protein
VRVAVAEATFGEESQATAVDLGEAVGTIGIERSKASATAASVPLGSGQTLQLLLATDGTTGRGLGQVSHSGLDRPTYGATANRPSCGTLAMAGVPVCDERIRRTSNAGGFLGEDDPRFGTMIVARSTQVAFEDGCPLSWADRSERHVRHDVESPTSLSPCAGALDGIPQAKEYMPPWGGPGA